MVVGESSINCSFLGFTVISSVLTLKFIASRFTVPATYLGGSWVAIVVAPASQPAVLSCAKSGHQVCEGRHRPGLVLPELSSKPFVADAVFKSCNCLCVRAIDYLIFLG